MVPSPNGPISVALLKCAQLAPPALTTTVESPRQNRTRSARVRLPAKRTRLSPITTTPGEAPVVFDWASVPLIPQKGLSPGLVGMHARKSRTAAARATRVRFTSCSSAARRHRRRDRVVDEVAVGRLAGRGVVD